MNKDWLDIAVLEDYLDGKLDARTMNRVEREALEDPFVAEALAGLSESPSRSLNSLSLLQKQLQERVVEHQYTKKRSVITWQRLSIAATAAVMFISVSIIFWMREENRQKELAGMPKKVEVTIAPKEFKDSVPVAADAVAVNNAATTAVDKALVDARKNSYASLKAKPQPVTAVAPVQAKEATAAFDKVSNNAMANDVVASEADVMAAPAQRKVGVAPPLAVEGMIRQKRAVLLINDHISGGSPQGGWPEFNRYLKENNRYVKDAKAGDSVMVKFVVKDGKPVDINVIKGVSERFDKEVVRLIKDGSDWQVQDPQKPVVLITIKF